LSLAEWCALLAPPQNNFSPILYEDALKPGLELANTTL
jgi:hypothetical protein